MAGRVRGGEARAVAVRVAVAGAAVAERAMVVVVRGSAEAATA